MNKPERTVSAEEAVKIIKSGDKIFVHSNSAVPKTLVKALANRHEELRNVEMYHILTLGDTEDTAPYTMPGMEKSFTTYSLFASKNTRQAINEGRAYYCPIFLHQVPRFVTNVGIDVALIQVSPPDSHGYCSLGVTVDVADAGVRSAKKVIAEINPQMPRTHGKSFFHISKFDYVVPVDYDLPTYETGSPSRATETIGKNVASLIDDGCVLQMGIGSIPDAALNCLYDRQHLGIHTEMFSDGVIGLIEKGIVDNSTKRCVHGTTLASFIIGSKKLYQWVDDNPMITMRPSDFTNNPILIASNDKVVAINSAIEIDLKGQVCSDSMGIRIYSGIGGQVDFIRGAAMSEGGKPIIAIESVVRSRRTGKVKTSKILPFLHEGAGVVTSEGDTHYVITEYGIAYLHGKGVGERATALINIAHPKFRRKMVETCKKINYLVDEKKIDFDQEEIVP